MHKHMELKECESLSSRCWGIIFLLNNQIIRYYSAADEKGRPVALVRKKQQLAVCEINLIAAAVGCGVYKKVQVPFIFKCLYDSPAPCSHSKGACSLRSPFVIECVKKVLARLDVACGAPCCPWRLFDRAVWVMK